MIKDMKTHLEDKTRTYVGPDMAYHSYNPPNTMYQVANTLDQVLLTCSYHSMKLWHSIMSRVKRNTDPVKVISIELRYTLFSDHLSRNYYYMALKELTDKELIQTTTTKCLYVINIDYAHKLYRPKFDIEV